MSDAYHEGVMAYWRAVGVSDPLRLQIWDTRKLTMPQLRLMYLLARGEKRTVGDLAKALHISPATATGLTNRLVRHGLIRRRGDSADRRLVLIQLTTQGREVVGMLGEAANLYVRPILERMTDSELDDFTRGVRAFLRAADSGLEDESEGAGSAGASAAR